MNSVNAQLKYLNPPNSKKLEVPKQSQQVSFNGWPEVAAIVGGAAVTAGSLYAKDVFVKADDTHKTTLEDLTSKALPMKAGIEIEFFTPKLPRSKRLRARIEKKAAEHPEKLTKKEAKLAELYRIDKDRSNTIEKDELVIRLCENPTTDPVIGLEFMDDSATKKPQKDFVHRFLDKKHKIDTGELVLTDLEEIRKFKEDCELFDWLKLMNGQSTLNNDGLSVTTGGPPVIIKSDGVMIKNHNKWKFLVDASVRPWHRSVEMVTPPLQSAKDLKLFASVTGTLKKLEPHVGIKEKLVDAFNNVRTQIGYLISGEDKYNRMGLEASKLGVPGYQGRSMTTSGYGSVHFHHDATNMKPIDFINEVNQYYNWQEVLTENFHPGLSRINFGKPMSRKYLEDLNEVAVPMIKAGKPDKKVWQEMAKIYVRHFRKHETLKYQALNQTNRLATGLDGIEDKVDIPETLKGMVGKKAHEKMTMEWRTNSSELDPRKVLLMNKLFQHMAIRAQSLAKHGEVIPLNKQSYKPWTKNRKLKEFCNTMNLKYADFKELRKPAWDGKILDDLLAGNTDDKLKPLGYPEVHLSSLTTTIPNIGNMIKQRLALLKEPEVLGATALGALTAVAIHLASKGKIRV